MLAKTKILLIIKLDNKIIQHQLHNLYIWKVDSGSDSDTIYLT